MKVVASLVTFNSVLAVSVPFPGLVIVIPFCPSLAVIDVIFVSLSTKPISSLPSTFLVRILSAAVVASAATVPSPTMSSFSPKFL